MDTANYQLTAEQVSIECYLRCVNLVSVDGSFLVYQFTRADAKDQTIHNSKPMTPKQRKNNGYSLVKWYTRTEPS